MRLSWDETLDAFRQLGGIADNVVLGSGTRGRGLFPLDNTMPVRLHVPDNLLVPALDVEFVAGRLTVRDTSNVGRAERAFFEEYQNSFSWGGGGRADCAEFIRGYDALPPEITLMLFGDDKNHAPSENFDARVGQMFLQSRRIARDAITAMADGTARMPVIEPANQSRTSQGAKEDETVLMPVIDLANHSPTAQFFGGIDGISVEGTFSDEILVRYAREDALGMFRSYGFASPERAAFCLASKYEGTNNLIVKRDMSAKIKRGSFNIPQFSIEGGTLVLSRMMLGNIDFPRLPKGIFRSVAEEAGWTNVDEEFDRIAHRNRMRFLGVLEMLEPHQGGLIPTIRKMARYQLEAMSHCVGTRDL